MSEQQPGPRPEQLKPVEVLRETEVKRSSSEKVETKGPERQLPGQKELAQAAESMAISGKEVNVTESETPVDNAFGMHQELKSNAYNRVLEQTRHHLSAPQRTFSRVIHAKPVEVVSDLSAKTVGRPSGILAGAILALIGSGYLLYASNHYGFSYNYSVFLLLFVGGFVIGVLLELVAKPFRKK